MLKLLTRLLVVATIIVALFYITRQPSNDKAWVQDLAKLPEVDVVETGSNTLVSIENVRDSSYEEGEEKIKYFSETYDVSKLEKMWFLVEPFSDWEAAAHTFFVFDFQDGKTLSFSVEARKEMNEDYSAFRGLLREYELFYLYGSERDLILRRTDFLDHEVYMYPVATTKENVQKLFLQIAQRANELESQPAFYNTVTSSCTTTLVRHINETSPYKVKWWYRGQYLPGLSDELAYDLGLLDTELPFGEIRESYSIKEVANNCSDSGNFSQCLRRGIELQID